MTMSSPLADTLTRIKRPESPQGRRRGSGIQIRGYRSGRIDG